MSESRDIETGPIDREEKRMKNSDHVKEAKDVSEEQNPSSLVATDREVSDKMTVLPSGEENVESPSKKQKTMHFMEGHDQTARDVMSESESESRRSSEEELQGKTGRIIAEFKVENYLFEPQLYRSNITCSTLTVPWETAEKHFLCDAGTHKELKVLFSDAYGKNWPLKLIIPPQPIFYLTIIGWTEFLGAHNLGAMDLIRYFKPVRPLHSKHYLVDYVKARRPESGNEEPYRKKTFRFRLLGKDIYTESHD